MRFDVPFVPDGEYCRFLADEGGAVGSVHFSLASPEVADARNPLHFHEADELVTSLDLLPGRISRYALLNARIQAPERYFDQHHLNAVAKLLERLADQAGLTGLVVADGYYLRALAATVPDLRDRLEVVPSVNCIIDSPASAASWLGLIEKCGFLPPSRLVLDRSLNRDIPRLSRVSSVLREHWPDLELLLLANESCLPHCPYKPSHHAHQALARMPGGGDRTFAINAGFGCVTDIEAEPWRMFTSPFIRPEDAARYEGMVDGLKLCGRERGGPPYLMRLIRAYTAGRFEGNLLSIMDTLGEFEDRMMVANDRLPEDFFERVSNCSGLCHTHCTNCAALAGLIERLEPGLPDLRERS